MCQKIYKRVIEMEKAIDSVPREEIFESFKEEKYQRQGTCQSKHYTAKRRKFYMLGVKYQKDLKQKVERSREANVLGR